jgi:hypothetical protein
LALSPHAFQAENITAGRGFIAVAMVYFGKWRPARVFFGTFLFGAAYMLGAFFQVVGSIILYYFLLMVLDILTLVVLVGIARGARAPSALGVPCKQRGRITALKSFSKTGLNTDQLRILSSPRREVEISPSHRAETDGVCDWTHLYKMREIVLAEGSCAHMHGR